MNHGNGNSPNRQLKFLNNRSVMKEAMVHRELHTQISFQYIKKVVESGGVALCAVSGGKNTKNA